MIVCGPTASGKSDLADELAQALSDSHGAWTPTLVVDSMQVYRELPIISNQARGRKAELTGIVSVTEEWNVARHREAADLVMAGSESRDFVLDAGTGMYLNAILLDLDLAPKVGPEIRAKAQAMVEGEIPNPSRENPRRDTREIELRLAAAGGRASIWDGDLRLETDLVYLRPPRDRLATAIERRTERILTFGTDEVRNLREMSGSGETIITPQVRGAIGLREVDQHMDGAITLPEARQGISRRTQALAKRQINWFDKLAKTLEGRATSITVESPNAGELKHYMHDILTG